MERIDGGYLVSSERVSAIFTNRVGPVAGTVGGTNLSRTVGDDPGVVLRARNWAARLVGADKGIAWGYQIHDANVVVADSATADGRVDGAPVAATDALVTDEVGVGVGVLVADCVPTLLATDDAVAVVHSGWRGLVAGVIQRAVETLESLGSGHASAVVGPAIHVCCYEVGDDVAAQIAPLGSDVVVDWHGSDRPHVDLRRAVTYALDDAGVEPELSIGPCTRCSDDYFSHRRHDRGRQGLVAGLRA